MSADDCSACNARRRQMLRYDLIRRMKIPSPTPSQLVTDFRGHRVVHRKTLARPRVGWDDFVVVKSVTDGTGGTQWYRLDGGPPLQVELFSGRFDGCWGHGWDLGATVRVDDPSEGYRCSTVLSFNDLADAVEWIGLLRPDRGYPDLLPFPESAYRVVDNRVSSASVSKWPPMLDGMPEDWSQIHGG